MQNNQINNNNNNINNIIKENNNSPNSNNIKTNQDQINLPSPLLDQPNKRARLQNIINTSPPIKQKRHNSQSSNSNQVSNKRSNYFTPYPQYTNNQTPNLNINSGFQSNQTYLQPLSNNNNNNNTTAISNNNNNQIPPQQYTSSNCFNQSYNQFRPSYYNRQSNIPTILTNSTSNFQLQGNNFAFTSNPQVSPRLHYQLLQSSIKKPSNLNLNFSYNSGSNLDLISKEGSIDNKSINTSIANPIIPIINSNSNNFNNNTNKINSQSPESFDNRLSTSYPQSQNMNNQQQNSLNQQINQSPQPQAQPQPQPQPQIQQTQSPQNFQQPQQSQQIQEQQNSQNQQSSQPQQQIVMSEEEQLLISNLQETYKSILKLEVETQHECASVNQKLLENNTGNTLNSELWITYKHVIQLLDHYYDFLLYALSPTSTRTGKPLVSNYRILKRMWVYGIVAFLEVLKNIVAIFVEHEVCSCFVSYSFNIISCLTDPELGIECWWAEKLGDLSRMAIALYPARYMDWKMSSVFWYQEAIKTQYGHGKIYYHLCSVENDNLEALMLIGKAVNSRDPFVPTPQYLRMIVDNVCSQRNMLTSIEMAMIDFVKIHKILLLPTYNQNEEMINITSHYASNFGADNTNIDFFQIRPDCLNNNKVTFWFQKGANFALSNIYHLMGFGSSVNPFAKIFDLPNALKERKDKKDRREKRRRSRSNSGNLNIDNNSNPTISSLDPNDPDFLDNSTASILDETYWFLLLDQINKGVLELSMSMLRQYIQGSVQTSTTHSIVWLYFLISVRESYKIYPAAKSMFVKLFQAVFPWKALALYLNDILCIVRSVPELKSRYGAYLYNIISSNNDRELFQLFAENETLWEVWKCWGSLWFDRVTLKTDYTTIFETGIKSDIFDLPLSGAIYNYHEDGERFIRILLLGSHICKYMPEFGLKMKDNIFKFEFNDEIKCDSLHFQNFINDLRIQSLLKFSGYNDYDKPSEQKEISNLNKENEKEKIINQEDMKKSKGEGDDYSFFSEQDVDFKFDFNKWINKNASPKLPLWDYNSFGFMTDFINNQYPANLAKKSTSIDPAAMDKNTEDNEYEEDSDDEFEDNENSDDHNDPYEVTSEGGSVNANPGTNLGSVSDLGNDQIHLSSIKPTIIKGDFGDFMDTSITFVSLDTNVWLKHCGRIFKCVRSRIFKLAIPLTVFQELRSLRKSNDSLVAESATRAVIIARQLYSENVVLAIRSDGTSASHINETREFEQNQNWRLNSDELILQSVKLNDAFGKSLCVGYGYSVGDLPKLPVYEEIGKIAGIYNGSYRGGYSVPNSISLTNNLKEDKNENNIKQSSSSNNSWSGKNPKELLVADNQGNRGEKLRSMLLSSKTLVLSKTDATEFRYNIIVTDDHDMSVRAETIGLKQMRSSEWFKIVDKVSFGRCFD